VFGIGDQEFARLGELVGVPAGIERSLAQYQVHVAAFPDSQADTDIHLRADGGSFAHGCLRRPLGRGDQVHRDGAAPARYRVGAVVRFLGQFGVFIGDDDERRIVRGGLPEPFAFGCHPCGPLVHLPGRIPE
jgi:hypothetical protein